MSRSPDSKFRVLLPTSDEDAVQQLEETLSPGLGDCAKHLAASPSPRESVLASRPTKAPRMM